MLNRREKIGLILGFVGMGMFAGTLPATRLAVDALDPLFVTAARTIIAGCAGLAMLFATRRALPPRELRLEIFAGGACSVLGFPLLAALAMMSVPVSLPKTRFVRTGDVIRPRLDVRRCLRSGRSGACLGHPFRAKHEDATHYNRRRISQGSASGALR
jgi:hypothetical protein